MNQFRSQQYRRYRPYYIVGLPLLLLACIGAITFIIYQGDSPFRAVPLMLLGFGMLRQMRWVMVWISTPAERRVLARNVEHEPLISVITAWLFGRRSPPQELRPRLVEGLDDVASRSRSNKELSTEPGDPDKGDRGVIFRK